MPAPSDPSSHALSESQSAENRLVGEMRAMIVGVLDGTRSRAEVGAWTREKVLPYPEQMSRFARGESHSVFESIYNIETLVEGEYLVREADLRGYVDWLTRVAARRMNSDCLLALDPSIHEVAKKVGREPIRFWMDGLGWFWSVEFCSPASGRQYYAETPGDPSQSRMSTMIHGEHDATWQDVVTDIFELLAIDERECAGLAKCVELEQLPCWELWRQDDNDNSVLIDTFRSFTKAAEAEQRFTLRGHRQTYWVQRAGGNG